MGIFCEMTITFRVWVNEVKFKHAVIKDDRIKLFQLSKLSLVSGRSYEIQEK